MNTFIISSTAWMRMAITHQVLVNAESSGWAVEKVFMLAGYTVWSRIWTASFTSMRVTDLLIIFLSGKPIIKIVTSVTLFPIIVTQTPESSKSLEEQKVVLPAGGSLRNIGHQHQSPVHYKTSTSHRWSCWSSRKLNFYIELVCQHSKCLLLVSCTCHLGQHTTLLSAYIHQNIWYHQCHQYLYTWPAQCSSLLVDWCQVPSVHQILKYCHRLDHCWS